MITAEIRLCNRGRRKASSESQHVDNVCRARCAVEEGQYRKAIQLLSSRVLVQASDEVRKEMLTKHPQATPPGLPPSPAPSPIRIEGPVVVKALRWQIHCNWMHQGLGAVGQCGALSGSSGNGMAQLRSGQLC